MVKTKAEKNAGLTQPDAIPEAPLSLFPVVGLAANPPGAIPPTCNEVLVHSQTSKSKIDSQQNLDLSYQWMYPFRFFNMYITNLLFKHISSVVEKKFYFF